MKAFAAGLVALLALGACVQRPQQATLGGPPAAMDDGRIAAAIQQALAADPELGAFTIDVVSKEGLVALGGVAPDPVARARATRIAGELPQVREVHNQLALRED